MAEARGKWFGDVERAGVCAGARHLKGHTCRVHFPAYPWLLQEPLGRHNPSSSGALAQRAPVCAGTEAWSLPEHCPWPPAAGAAAVPTLARSALMLGHPRARKQKPQSELEVWAGRLWGLARGVQEVTPAVGAQAALVVPQLGVQTSILRPNAAVAPDAMGAGQDCRRICHLRD